MPGLQERFEAKCIPEPNSGCWLWFGAWSPQTGYGFINGDLAHRVSYRLFTGPIPGGLQIDHLCRMRCCVNPDHLEAVTCKTNIQRGETGKTAAKRQQAKTHCKAGHPYSVENTILVPGRAGRGGRVCRICQRGYELRRQEKHFQLRCDRPPPPPKTLFKCGHPFTDENTMLRKNRKGGECKTCNRLRAAAAWKLGEFARAA